MLDIRPEDETKEELKDITLTPGCLPTDRNYFFLIFHAPDEESLSSTPFHDELQKRKERNLENGKSEPQFIYVNWFDFDKNNKIIPERKEKYNKLKNINSPTKIILFGHGSGDSYTLSSEATYPTEKVDSYYTLVLGKTVNTRTHKKEKTSVHFNAKQVATLLDLIPSPQKLTLSLSVCQGEVFSKALGFHLFKDHNREFCITSVKRNFSRTVLNVYPTSRFACLNREFIHILNMSSTPWLMPLIIMAQSSPPAQDIILFTIFASLAVISQILSGVGFYINTTIIPKISHINATKKVVMFHDKTVHHRDDRSPCSYMLKIEYLKKYGNQEDQKKIKNFILLDKYRQAENLLWINSLFLHSGLLMISVDAAHSNPFSTTLCYNLSSTNVSFPVWALLLLIAAVTNICMLYPSCKAQPAAKNNPTKKQKEVKSDIGQPLLTSSLNF